MDQSDSVGESVDELRQRLSGMKKTLAERRKTFGYDNEPRKNTPGIIDGTFMSMVFGTALFVIISNIPLLKSFAPSFPTGSTQLSSGTSTSWSEMDFHHSFSSRERSRSQTMQRHQEEAPNLQRLKRLFFDPEKKTVLTKNKDSWCSIVMGTILTLLLLAAVYRSVLDTKRANLEASKKNITAGNTSNSSNQKFEVIRAQQNFEYPEILNNLEEKREDFYYRHKRSPVEKSKFNNVLKKNNAKKPQLINKVIQSKSANSKIPNKLSGQKKAFHKKQTAKKNTAIKQKGAVPKPYQLQKQKTVSRHRRTVANETEKNSNVTASLLQPATLQKIVKRETHIQKIPRRNQKANTRELIVEPMDNLEKSNTNLSDPNLKGLQDGNATRVARFLPPQSYQGQIEDANNKTEIKSNSPLQINLGIPNIPNESNQTVLANNLESQKQYYQETDSNLQLKQVEENKDMVNKFMNIIFGNPSADNSFFQFPNLNQLNPRQGKGLLIVIMKNSGNDKQNHYHLPDKKDESADNNDFWIEEVTEPVTHMVEGMDMAEDRQMDDHPPNGIWIEEIFPNTS